MQKKGRDHLNAGKHSTGGCIEAEPHQHTDLTGELQAWKDDTPRRATARNDRVRRAEGLRSREGSRDDAHTRMAERRDVEEPQTQQVGLHQLKWRHPPTVSTEGAERAEHLEQLVTDLRDPRETLHVHSAFEKRAVRWKRWHTTTRTLETTRDGDPRTPKSRKIEVGQVDYLDIGMMSTTDTTTNQPTNQPGRDRVVGVATAQLHMTDVAALDSGSKTKATARTRSEESPELHQSHGRTRITCIPCKMIRSRSRERWQSWNSALMRSVSARFPSKNS